MCLRYSSSVVAPIVCSSPRASIGLSMFDASSEPSAAPAPTTVCSSSMKSTIWPSASTISLSTALSRSSNSPRYFAPATSAPMSRPTIFLFFSPSGTSPRTMRCARPFDDGGLADAGFADQHRVVLGAARQHLDDAAHFFVAADHRIELAVAGELGEIAAVPLERLVLVLGILIGHALVAANRRSAPRARLSRVTPRCLSRSTEVDSPGLGEQAEQQVLGADVLVLHRLGFGLRGVEHDAQARGQVRLGAAVRLRLPAEMLAQRSRATPPGSALSFCSTVGTTPSGCSSERDEQVLGLDLRVIQLRGQLRRREDGFLCLFGELVQIHDGFVSSQSLARAPRSASVPRPSASAAARRRRSHRDRRRVRPSRSTAARGRAGGTPGRSASPAESSAAATCRRASARRLRRRAPPSSRHADLGVEVAALALEPRVRPQLDAQVQIAAGAATACRVRLRRDTRTREPSVTPAGMRTSTVRCWPSCWMPSRCTLPCSASSRSSSNSCSTSRPLRLRGARAACRGAPAVGSPPPKNVRKKSENGLSSPAEHVRHFFFGHRPEAAAARRVGPLAAERAAGPAPGRPCAAPARTCRQFAPSSSYFLRFSGSPSTSLASLISLNLLRPPCRPGSRPGDTCAPASETPA